MRTVHLNKHEIALALARKKSSIAAIAITNGSSASTFYDAIKKGRCTPRAAGELAQALGVDVSVIVEADR